MLNGHAGQVLLCKCDIRDVFYVICTDMSAERTADHRQVVAHLEPLQQRYNLIMEDKTYLDEVLAKGAGMSCVGCLPKPCGSLFIEQSIVCMRVTDVMPSV